MSEANPSENNDIIRLRRRHLALGLLSGLFLALAFFWLCYWLVWGRYEVYTDDAYVNGNIVQLMSQIAGTVTEIGVDDTQRVTEGQTIIRFDPADMAIALQHAREALAETVRRVQQMYENAWRAEANLTLRRAQLLEALNDLDRRRGLVGNSAVSGEEYRHYQTAEETARAQYDIALHNLRFSLAQVANTHLYTHPLVEQAKANLRTAFLNAERTTIVAPVSGYIAKRSVQVGQRVLVNTPMLAIVPLSEIWVDANYKESQLENLRIGQPVILYADARPGVIFHGKVYGLNAGTGAAFSLLPPQNATGNWIKIVQRLAVRIAMDPEELIKNPLQLGLSMRVTTSTHDTRGRILAEQQAPKLLYSTTVYAHQLAKASQLIDKILRDNSPDLFMQGIELNA